MKVTAVGLFLAMFAAFALAAGSPAVIAGEATSIEKAFSTESGKVALEKAGVSASQLSEMVSKLTPEQRAKVEGMLSGLTPEARLTSRMLAAGYTEAEVAQRIAVLSSDELVQIAASEEATTSAGAVGTIIFVAALVVLALVIVLYFLALEPVEERPMPLPAPEATM